MVRKEMGIHKVSMDVGDKTLSIETGRYARQAAASVTVQMDDTVILAAAATGPPRVGIDFFPLTVDYREKTYAAGKFPGGFYKREARPTQKEILTMRMTDRPLRPLFPKGFRDEVQLQTMVLATDQQNNPDILSMIGASACVSISSIPLDGPVGSVRVGRVDGKFIAFPTVSELEQGDLDMILAGHKDAVNMIEVGAHELSEEVIAEAIKFGHSYIIKICNMIQELANECGEEVTWVPPEEDQELLTKLTERAQSRFREIKHIHLKQERQDAISALYKEIEEEFSPADSDNPPYERSVVHDVLDKIEEGVVTDMILNEGVRSDGRGPDDIRPIMCEVGILPRVHGSAVFTRGETQSLVITTLGTGRDEQIIDGIMEEYSKKFMLHYNFPPFCTGEVRRIGAVSRREIGHGSLAERSLEMMLPSPDVFPYTIRLVSEILESNGSSSMASVCGGTLALMDAGVPITHPVAGISVGMFHNDEKYQLVVDILGEEDHFGDMDFKVSGTQRGITGIQLDLKARGLSHQQIVEALEKARIARMIILKQMLSVLPKPRAEISEYAPRILKIKINPEKIGKVIGPGGKGIKGIEAQTGAQVEIEEDGTIFISCVDMKSAIAAREMVEAVTEEVKIGKIYTGRVTSVKDFGAFIEVTPGQDGLCHISELSDGYVRQVDDVCQIGDVLRVKVILVDNQGRIKLSRKAAIQEEGNGQEES